MIIGVPKEIKNHEYRVGLMPEAAKILVKNGHKVLIENGAGTGSGFSDEDYKKSGALVTNGPFAWLSTDIIVKVKEPIGKELEKFSNMTIDWSLEKRSNLIIFAFFHFPANPHLKKFIFENGFRAVPYENIQLPDGSFPVLAKMAEIAGEESVDIGAHNLRKENDGKGILLKDSQVMVLGCEGTAGRNVMKISVDRGAKVIGFDKAEKIQPTHSFGPDNKYAKDKFGYSPELVARFLPETDLLVCAARNKREGAPKLITRKMVQLMKPGSVIVDISIDEGGCCETSHATTHDNPVYVEESVIHYCVANMPGVVPHSSTPALVKATLPYILEVANKGWQKALEENPVLAQAAKID